MINRSRYLQVHKETISEVPNSVHGRTDVEIEIYGMEGIPEKDLEEHARQKQNKDGSNAKRKKMDDSDDSDDQNDSSKMRMPYSGMMPGPMGMPNMMPGPMGMPGMMGMNMNMMQMPPMGMMGGPMMGGPNIMGGRWPMPNPGMMGPQGMMMGGPMGVRPGGMMNSGGPMPTPSGITNADLEANKSNPSMAGDNASEISNAPKLLFPAASQIQQTANKSSVDGAGANSQSSKSNLSAGIKLVHPDDDISLEERRAQCLKYKKYLNRGKRAESALAPQATYLPHGNDGAVGVRVNYP